MKFVETYQTATYNVLREARQDLKISDFAQEWKCNRDTASRKLSGKSSITLDEAFAIQRKFFPEMDLKTLFVELLNPPKAG